MRYKIKWDVSALQIEGSSTPYPVTACDSFSLSVAKVTSHSEAVKGCASSDLKKS